MTQDTELPQTLEEHLQSCIEAGDHNGIVRCIADGADVNAIIGASSTARPPIETAVRMADVEACRLLLSALARPEWSGTDHRGQPRAQSALQKFLVFKNSDHAMVLKICSMLIDAGASPDGVDSLNNHSPVYLAAGNGYWPVVDLLIDSGASINATELGGKLLQKLSKMAEGWVSDSDRETLGQAIALLVRRGADDSCLDMPDMTLFQQCVKNGLNRAVEYLVCERGEDLAQRVNGRTLIQLARHQDTRHLLRSLKTSLSVAGGVGSVSEAKVSQVPVGMGPL